jgi:2'-hydroxyisoflavone reductase
VVDTSGYVPRVVRDSARLLSGSIGRYCFISTCSVYADHSKLGLREDDAVGTLADESVEDVGGETYGPLKALCEQAVAAELGERAVSVRPGLIVGPHDRTDRFGYWVLRVADGGAVLAPAIPDGALQSIDVRDLAAFVLALLEAGRSGVYNAVGPAEPYTWRELLETCREVSASDARIVWADEQFLLDSGVEPFASLPLWLPSSTEEWQGFYQHSNEKALAAGMTYRPLAETVTGALAFERERLAGNDAYTGSPPIKREPMSREREQELIASWLST